MFPIQSDESNTVLKFLENDDLLELVKTYLAKDKMESAEHLLVRRFLMCNLMYRNAQRQGPIISMKIAEFEEGREYQTSVETVMVYKVWEHKTITQFGSANLVMPVTFHQLIRDYIRSHRPQPAEGCEDYIFLTPQ